MAVPLSLGPVHHLRLTVTDVERSRVFYTELLGFQIAMDAPPPADDPHHDLATDLLQDGIVMVNGDLLLGLRPVDAERGRVRLALRVRADLPLGEDLVAVALRGDGVLLRLRQEVGVDRPGLVVDLAHHRIADASGILRVSDVISPT